MNTNYIDLDWIKAHHTMIHPFGLGFIQVKLGPDERMHFWHPNFQRDREELHNHRYDFHSTIIRGMMVQEIYAFDVHDEGCTYRVHETDEVVPATHELVMTDCMSAHETEFDSGAKGTIRLEFAGILTIGSEYTLNMNTFHRVEAKKCVSLLRRGPKVKTHAQIVREIGTHPPCPFAEKMDVEVMWSLVEDCLYG